MKKHLLFGILILSFSFSASVWADKGLPSGEVAYTAPKGWVQEEPKTSMRKAQFRLPGGKGSKPGELAVFFFPGSGGAVEANLQRWYRQFKKSDGQPITKPHEKEKLNVRGLPVTTVFLRGTYLKSKSPMMMRGPKEKKPGYALLAAIAETKEGPWFFKATGPEKTIRKWKPGFNKFIQSFRIKN